MGAPKLGASERRTLRGMVVLYTLFPKNFFTSVSYTHLLVQEGDTISIDIPAGKVNVDVSDEELERRRAAWKAPEPRITTGWLSRYAKLVSGANKGAVME